MAGHLSSGRAGTLVLLTILAAGALTAIWCTMLSHARQPDRARLVVFQADALILRHPTLFITLTNGSLADRAKRFAGWELSRYRGFRFPALSQELTLGGLANLYRSVDTISPGVEVPLEFFQLKASFTTNCVLTNAQTRLPVFRRALEEALCHNGVVGIRDGPLLKLVKQEWVQANSAGSPPLTPGDPTNRSSQ